MNLGIIGGQDGPTAILVSSDPVGLSLMLLTVLVAVTFVWFFLHKRKK